MSNPPATLDVVVMTIDEIQALAERILMVAGLNRPHAESVARVITAGERDGCLSHGPFDDDRTDGRTHDR